MLSIPLPLLYHAKLRLRQKLILLPLFSLGIFVIFTAILTKVENLTHLYSPHYMLWYTREASTAVYVSNLPLIWPLFREWFPCIRSLTPVYAHSNTPQLSTRRASAGSNEIPSSATTAEHARLAGLRRSPTGFDSIFARMGIPPISNAELGFPPSRKITRTEHATPFQPLVAGMKSCVDHGPRADAGDPFQVNAT